MKTDTNFNELFTKLDDLKTVFRYGEKLIPIIHGIIEFMSETVPLMENINNSITESASKIPKATNQIQKVTSATEIATTEILDTIDEISNDLNKATQKIVELQDASKKHKDIVELVKSKLENPSSEVIELLDSLVDVNDVYAELQSITSEINNKIYRITLSLQVQDITSQQLATVNHLIESVQEKLTFLISDFETASTKENKESIELPAGSTFDPNASYSNKKDEQEQADILVNNHHLNTSQAEIDRLFGK